MIRNLWIFLLASFFSLSTFAQTNAEEIKKTFSDYFQTIEHQDYAQTLDFIYPKLFEHFPKELMKQAMEKMSADSSLQIAMKDAKVGEISEVLETDGVQYALLPYEFRMTMTFLGEEQIQEGEDFMDPAQMTYEVLQTQYGKENVDFHSDSRQIVIRVANELYAIKDPAFGNWKFLEKKTNMMSVLEQLIPQKVIDSL